MKNNIYNLNTYNITLRNLMFLAIISLTTVSCTTTNFTHSNSDSEYKAIWKEDISIADTLLKHNPETADAHYRKANALAHLGKYKQAIISFDLAIKYKFKHLPWLYYERGNSLRALNKLEEALSSYDMSMKLGCEEKWVYFAKYEILIELGRDIN